MNFHIPAPPHAPGAKDATVDDQARPDQSLEDDPRGQSGQSGHASRLLLDTIIPYQINRLSHRMNRYLDRELRSHGLSISIWRVMAVLDHAGAATVNDLAHYAMIEQSTLSRMLQRMKSEGLVENARSSSDGRARTISMTQAGRSRYETVRDITMKHTQRIVDGFSRAERAQLMGFIRRMQKNVETPERDGGKA